LNLFEIPNYGKDIEVKNLEGDSELVSTDATRGSSFEVKNLEEIQNPEGDSI
jgi:hypothetical protein